MKMKVSRKSERSVRSKEASILVCSPNDARIFFPLRRAKEPDISPDKWKVFFNGGRHHNLCFLRLLEANLVSQGDLLVPLSYDRDAELQIACDLVEIIAFWVAKGDPLVLQSMLVLKINEGHIEIIRPY